jgi:Metallo-peptidase family M12/Domain of unknown function DUF11
MSNGRRGATFAALAIATGSAAHAAQPTAHILQHEAITLTSSAERVSFEAFGKHFDLLLEPNERIHHPSDIVPYRGTVAGLPRSWVRLTRGPSGRYSGMLSDGTELYAIESAADISAMAVQPLEKSSQAPVMYRLKDLIVEWSPAFCEALPAGEPTTGLDAFKSLGAELQSAAVTKQIEIGVVGDFEFNSFFNPAVQSATQAVIARMNVVDGIFSEQVGVTVKVPTIQLFETAADPFTQSESKALLDEARAYRRMTPEQLSRGLTHLMTGRDMTGDTVGVAYMGTVCGGEFAVSLSEGARSSTMAALIAAHEIGHNFNAPHDGDGACAAEAQTFLMAPQINGSDQFSACSLQQMAPKVATASCLTAFSPADAAVEAPANVQGTVSNSLALSFNVRAIGDSSSQDVSVTAVIPAALTLSSSTASGGTCTTGAGTLSCVFGSMDSGATRNVSMNVTSQSTGTFPIDVTVSSSNDSVSGNNTGRVDVVMTSSTPNPGQPVNSSGGGGGSIGFGLLAALGGLSLLRQMKRALSRPAAR